MRMLLVIALLSACGGDNKDPIDQTGKFMVRFGGDPIVVDGVAYGLALKHTSTALAGRKRDDGTVEALVSRAHLQTKPFQAPGKGEVRVDLTVDLGKSSGAITIAGVACKATKLYWGTGTINDVPFQGFTGTCLQDGKEIEFDAGLVK